MLAQTLLGMDWTHWQAWIAPLAGLASAGLVAWGGRYFLMSRPPTPRAPAPQAPPTIEEVPPPPAPVNPYLYGAPKRRKAPRGNGAAVRVMLTNEDHTAEPFAALVINRSIGGLCLIASQPLEVGALLHVRPIQDQLEGVWLPITIRHCKQQDFDWEIGCQFVRTPTYSTLMMFG